MKVQMVKEVMACDVSPVWMFLSCTPTLNVITNTAVQNTLGFVHFKKSGGGLLALTPYLESDKDI